MSARDTGVDAAIEEQQEQVWFLVSQLQCLRAAVEDLPARDGIDLCSAVGAAIQLGEQIHSSLDAGGMIKRGAAIDADRAEQAPGGES